MRWWWGGISSSTPIHRGRRDGVFRLQIGHINSDSLITKSSYELSVNGVPCFPQLTLTFPLGDLTARQAGAYLRSKSGLTRDTSYNMVYPEFSAHLAIWIKTLVTSYDEVNYSKPLELNFRTVLLSYRV